MVLESSSMGIIPIIRSSVAKPDGKSISIEEISGSSAMDIPALAGFSFFLREWWVIGLAFRLILHQTARRLDAGIFHKIGIVQLPTLLRKNLV